MATFGMVCDVTINGIRMRSDVRLSTMSKASGTPMTTLSAKP